MSKQHRTALVLEVNASDTDNYKNRVNRVLESVNGPNIKVDIYTFDSASGRYFEGVPTNTGPQVEVDFDSLGYVATLSMSPADGHVPDATPVTNSIW